MITRNIIVIGASAGGVTALKEVVKGLHKDFNGSVFVVLHIPSYSDSKLPWILSKAGPLKAVHPMDGEEIKSGMIYVAPNDHHLILKDDKVLVKKGPRENRFRPSIDALFRSAAYTFKNRVIGVILSGVLDDGVSGLWTIKELGGLTIIQNPEDAEQGQLPLNVLEHIKPDYLLKASQMGAILAGIVEENVSERFKLPQTELERLKMEVIIASRDNAFDMGIMNLGELTPFTCPNCHGALVRLTEGKILRYRCHTGHAYTASSLLAEVTASIEGMLLQSMRGMEEMNMLLENIANHYQNREDEKAAELFRAKAREGAKKVRIIHDSILSQSRYSEDIRLNKEEGYR